MATRKKARPTLKEIEKAVTGKTRAEIVQYFKENNIVDTPHLKHADVAAAGELVIRDACIDDDDKFHFDTNSVDVLVEVWDFYLRTHVDMSGMSFEDAFDIIVNNDLANAIEEIYPRTIDESAVSEYVWNAIDDIRANEVSATALLAKITDAINSITRQAEALIVENPDTAKKVIDIANATTQK